MRVSKNRKIIRYQLRNKYFRETFISANSCRQFSIGLGDLIICIKSAFDIASSIDPDYCTISLIRDHPYNILWKRFIREHTNKQIYISPEFSRSKKESKKYKNDQKKDFDLRDQQLTQNQKINYIEISSYVRSKYRANIYKTIIDKPTIMNLMYHTQLLDMPAWINPNDFDTHNIIDFQKDNMCDSIFIAPEEISFHNEYFTLIFWGNLINHLNVNKVPITLNGNPNTIPNLCLRYPELVTYVYPSIDQLSHIISNHKLVLCGSTGIAWMSLACKTPIVIFESNYQYGSHLDMYSFKYLYSDSIMGIIKSNNLEQAIKFINQVYGEMK